MIPAVPRTPAERARRSFGDSRRTRVPARRDVVLATGLLMVAGQLILRGWALYPSWFYFDDYRLLYDAGTQGLSWSYLVAPFDSQFMPVGRLVAWLVSVSGTLNWSLAASITLVVQGLAGVACLWMLVTLFGVRWRILAPLAIYLTSALSIPALMWWAASLNQLPLQAVFFLAVGCGVRYLRGRRLLWLGLCLLTVAVGLLCYVKALLVVPVLGFLALGYFSSGSLPARLRSTVARYWPAAAAATVLGVLYVTLYETRVPQPFGNTPRGIVGPLADTLLGTSFLTGAFGGPWSWASENLPSAPAQPPDWSVHLAWTAAVLVVLYGALTRRRTLRAWGLLTGYLAAVFVLLLTTRATVVGAGIGLQYRYLTDAVCALSLSVGLAFIPLVGAAESSEAREVPLLRATLPRRWVAAGLVLLCLSGVASSTTYAAIWHDHNPGEVYLNNTRADLRRLGNVDLADQTVPNDVVLGLLYPSNTTKRLVPLMHTRARFPETTSRLAVLADDGRVHGALMNALVRSTPGPVPGCGWRVKADPVTIPLTGPIVPGSWWLRIGYLGSGESPVTVTAGRTRVTSEIRPGLNSLFVRTQGDFDSVTLEGLAPGTTLCVDTLEVGQPIPGAQL